MTRSSAFMEYIKLHEISLLQDAEKLQKLMDDFTGNLDSDEYTELEIADYHNTGELIATRHLLSVATDIMNSSNERYE
jgi:hypothetical protein